MKCDSCRKKVKALYNPVVKSGFSDLRSVNRMVRVCQECKPKVRVTGSQEVVDWREPHQEFTEFK